MAKMKVVQVPKPGADLELVEREVPQPLAGHVRTPLSVKTWTEESRPADGSAA